MVVVPFPYKENNKQSNHCHLAMADRLYHGFLGSDGARFPGQSTTDIHYRDLAQPGMKIRQRSVCCAVGYNFVFIEHWIDGEWITADIWLFALQILNEGPVPPLPAVCTCSHLPSLNFGTKQSMLITTSQWPQPLVEPMSIIMLRGVPTAGYWTPWFHNLTEQTRDPLTPMHYYQHTKRSRHDYESTPTLVPDGTHHVFTELALSTHVQSYRLAKNPRHD